jgi:hypothetical protein
MQHLDKIDEVGKGIAVAFVATLYGVGAANLILLPCAGKLKIRIRNEQIIREMTLEGVISILEGMNPRILEAKLLGFLTDAHGPAAGAGLANSNSNSNDGNSDAGDSNRLAAAGDAPVTPTMIAGWFPTRTSSRSCLPSLWCSTLRRKWTREKSENWL